MADSPRLATESIAGRRPYQEDSVFADNLSDGRTLVAVADGMGGHAAGEVASDLALETLVLALEDGEGLAAAFRLANERVHSGGTEPGQEGMGTTLVALLLDGDEYMIANVGDSRGYQISSDEIQQLTEDHSFMAEAIKQGQSEDEAMRTPWKDILTRAIGTQEEVEVDVLGPSLIEQDTAFLICSDGLYKVLRDQQLRDLFTKSLAPQDAVKSLVIAAFEGGSDDNISVAIAEYGQVPRATPPSKEILSYSPEADSEHFSEVALQVEDLEEEPPPILESAKEAVLDGSDGANSIVGIILAVLVALAVAVILLVG
ncbi:MAG: protein phosphatase 2C domain-containing protein [Gemmatimonadetes bacterium]|nr:protein phosphatase 2C domain-containing protein [Gemmatimonadota bacterium]